MSSFKLFDFLGLLQEVIEFTHLNETDLIRMCK